MAFFDNTPLDEPELWYIDPPASGKQESVFYLKPFGLSLSSQLHNLLGFRIALHTVFDRALEFTAD